MNVTQGTRATILLVEDDLTTATMLRDGLTSKAYCVWHAQNGAEAEAMVDEVRPDLIIVDLMLPDVHGLVLSANLKEKWAAPIIICSATKRKEDPVLGFKLGAEDFVAKPFSFDELEARVEAALRRATLGVPAQGTPLESEERIGQLAIDRARCRVTLGEQEIRLTPTEYRLLCALANRPDQVLSREELAERVWGYHDPGVARSLEVHLRRLRLKLTAGRAAAPPLVTVRGFGYRLVNELPSESEAIPVARA